MVISLNELIDAARGAARDLRGEIELGPFSAYSRAYQSEQELREEPVTPIREDPIFGPVAQSIEQALDRGIEEISDREIREQVRTNPEVQRSLQTATRELEERTMPVTYDQWISIAFEIAREKGADFSTTQEEVESGDAPTVDAMKVFASIWNERRSEIAASPASARRVAEQEISIR